MYVSPDSPIGLLLRIAGLGTLLLVIVGGALLLVLLLAGLLVRRPSLVRWSAIGLAAVVGLWAVSLLLSLVLLRGRTLGPGEELAYCGFDCHLHVGVREVRRAARLEVTLALRSDAKAAPEYPAFLDFAVTSSDGRRFPPVTGDVGGALNAGDARDVTLGFDVPVDARDLRLVGNWRGTPDWLMPGPDQALVQRRTGIALQQAGATP